MHSQRLNEAPLKTWVIARSSGEILSPHCNCMAGLAEVCIHVAFLLFWTEISIKKQRIFYCNRLSCLLSCTIKSKPPPTTKNSGNWLSSSKKGYLVMKLSASLSSHNGDIQTLRNNAVLARNGLLQRWINIVDQHWNNVDPTMKIK